MFHGATVLGLTTYRDSGKPIVSPADATPGVEREREGSVNTGGLLMGLRSMVSVADMSMCCAASHTVYAAVTPGPEKAPVTCGTHTARVIL